MSTSGWSKFLYYLTFLKPDMLCRCCPHQCRLNIEDTVSVFLGLREMKVDFSWAHTTQSMAVGYMTIQDQTPTVYHVFTNENQLYILK